MHGKKESAPGSPLLSIVTVCLNSEKYLEQTIQSVLKQTYKNIEYVIIDGGSGDGTLGIIKKYAGDIAYWVSEPDRGVYHAMNKGIKASTGDIVYFLNSDDYLFDEHVVEAVMNCFEKNKDAGLVYGHVILADPPSGLNLCMGREISTGDLKKGITTPHQGLFMRKDILAENGLFNEGYKIAADFDLLVKCFIRGYKALYIDKVIAYYRFGGISNNFLMILEYREIIKKYFGTVTYLKYLYKTEFKNICKQALLKTGMYKYFRKI